MIHFQHLNEEDVVISNRHDTPQYCMQMLGTSLHSGNKITIEHEDGSQTVYNVPEAPVTTDMKMERLLDEEIEQGRRHNVFEQ